MMKEMILDKAKDLGADLVSFLNLKDYKSPRSPNPLRYLPSAKSIVVLAFSPLAGAYRYGENTWSKMPSFLYAVESAGNTAAYHLGKFMEREFKAESFLVQAHRPFEINEETFRSPIGSVSLRHAAVQSGMAVWGKNTLALTREYGPRVMFLGLLNSLDLESDPPIEGYDPCSLLSDNAVARHRPSGNPPACKRIRQSKGKCCLAGVIGLQVGNPGSRVNVIAARTL